MAAGSDSQNDVWATLTNLGGEFISANRDIKLAQAGVTTRATPNGKTDQTVANPFPGTQGAYPMAEAKPQPGGGFALNFSGGMFWIVAAIVAVFVFGMLRK